MFPDARRAETETETKITSATIAVATIAMTKLVLHLMVAGRYGYFGDELYYLACAERLDWGYVDQPPLFVLVAWIVRHTLGTSLLALKLVPALAGAVKIILAAMIARELGGGRLAQILAAVATLVATVYLAIDYVFTMNALEPVIWMACALIVLRIVRTGNQKLWIAFGAVAGLGLQMKYSMAVFGLAVVLALLLTPERRSFAARWVWIGGSIAFVIFLPNLLWNVQNGWPFLELMRNIRESGRDVRLPLLAYLGQQVMVMNPVTFPLWLTGAAWLLFARAAKPFRVLGWVFAITVGFFLLMRAKDYYTAPVYPIALAAGGVVWERMKRTSAAYIAALAVSGAALAPLAIPLLPIERLIAYQQALPFEVRKSEVSHMETAIPHHFAWSFGWEEMAAATARVYHALPPEERAKTAIFANNFAEGGAIDLFGPKYGLPKAVGGHQNYFLWGPRGYSGEVVIVLGDEADDAAQWFESVEVAAEVDHPYARPSENGPILVARRLKGDLREVWPKLKSWY